MYSAKKAISSCILTLGIFLLIQSSAFSQIENVSVSTGLTVFQIIGDNPGADNILAFNPEENAFSLGGGYTAKEPGIGIFINIAIDEEENFVVPIGYEHVSLLGLERFPSQDTSYFVSHRTQVSSIVFGLNYKFYKFPFANVKAYVGCDGRVSILHGEEFQAKKVKDDASIILPYKTKESAIRGGAAIRIGFHGEIYDPLFINCNFGTGIVNLFGRDDERGELFTPQNDHEAGESIVFSYLFNLQLEYRF